MYNYTNIIIHNYNNIRQTIIVKNKIYLKNASTYIEN